MNIFLYLIIQIVAAFIGNRIVVVKSGNKFFDIKLFDIIISIIVGSVITLLYYVLIK
jgi:hypothetical protein